jgi:hypothetical protein
MRGLLAALFCFVSGCAALPTITERPEEYHLYRTARVAPTLEERLRAADRYLREVPRGPHAKQLRDWFTQTEERYYLSAFNRLPQLYAYEQALPRGPHIEEVRTRIVALEARRARQRESGLDEERIAATQGRLVRADASRRAFVAAVKDWALRLAQIESFGEPTSELSDDTIFAFRLSPPRGACRGDSCRKLVELSYEVPGERQLVERAALLEIQLELERGLLSSARLAGPELWLRLAEALSLQPLPSPTPQERAAAVGRAVLLLRAVLEPELPAGECDKAAQPPILLERACRGLRVRMIAGKAGEEDDVLEVVPEPKVAAPGRAGLSSGR